MPRPVVLRMLVLFIMWVERWGAVPHRKLAEACATLLHPQRPLLRDLASLHITDEKRHAAVDTVSEGTPVLVHTCLYPCLVPHQSTLHCPQSERTHHCYSSF
jgi:hypothetical protein